MIPKEIAGINYTNIEKVILKTLGDGRAYTLEELKTYDKLVDDLTIKTHIHNMRKKINQSSYRIYSGYENGKLIYRLMHILILN